MCLFWHLSGHWCLAWKRYHKIKSQPADPINFWGFCSNKYKIKSQPADPINCWRHRSCHVHRPHQSPLNKVEVQCILSMFMFLVFRTYSNPLPESMLSSMISESTLWVRAARSRTQCCGCLQTYSAPIWEHTGPKIPRFWSFHDLSCSLCSVSFPSFFSETGSWKISAFDFLCWRHSSDFRKSSPS